MYNVPQAKYDDNFLNLELYSILYTKTNFLHDFNHANIYFSEIQILCKLQDDNLFYLEYFQKILNILQRCVTMTTLQVLLLQKQHAYFHLYLY